MKIVLHSKQLCFDDASIHPQYISIIMINPIAFIFKNMPSFLNLCIIFLFYTLSFSHYIHKVSGDPIQITSFTNQANSISIPYHKCFKVKPELQANNKYIHFTPSSLKLGNVQEGQIGRGQAESVIEDLRNPHSYTHINLIVLSNYSLVFSSPKNIKIIKEKYKGIEDPLTLNVNNTAKKQFYVSNKYSIEKIDQFTRFKIYKLNENEALLFIYDSSYHYQRHQNKKKILLLNQNGYEEYKTPNDNDISFMVSLGEEFFTAEYDKGIGCYKLNKNSKKVSVQANYGPEIFGESQIYIADLSINNLKSHQIMYALDKYKGVYLVNLTESNQKPHVQLILNEPNCNAIDSVKLDHIVLACQLGSTSYIVEAYAQRKPDGTVIYQKLQPQYHFNYFSDLEINTNYFMVFSHKALNVYWSSKENKIPETVNTQSQLDLPGLETFFFGINPDPTRQSFLYTIQAGAMRKYRITESQAQLSVKSSTQLNSKQFKISIFGNCQDLPDNILSMQERSNLRGITCELQQTVRMQITQENSPRKQDFSVSASIIVILIVVFLLIIWICLKKYKGLEREARKILQNYKKKKPRQRLAL